MNLIEKYIDCMQRGNNIELANLFNHDGVLHDSSLIKLNKDTLHLEGKAAIEMMFHRNFGLNGGPFLINSVNYKGNDRVWYFITYNGIILQVAASIDEVDEDGKILRLNIYPL